MSGIVSALPGWRMHVASWFRSLSLWHYKGGKRDLRLDFLRGFAVVAMIVDHVGGSHSWLYVITGGDRFFVSVAEVFVFISGLLMGSIYTGLIARQGLGTALMKCLQRSWHLYLLTLTLTLLFAALSQQWGLWEVPLPWSDFILSVVTLHRTFPLTDIPLLYTLLVLAAVPVLILLTHGYTSVVLAGSWGLWALWHLAPQHAQFPWAIAGNEVFYFSAWQVLFVTALVIGYHRQRLEQYMIRLSLPVILVISGAFVAGAIALYAFDILPLLTDNAVLVYQLLSKADLGPGRLLVFAGFLSFGLTLLTVAWGPISRALNWLLLPLGQNALTAYTLHLFVVACLMKARPRLAATTFTPEVQNTLLQLVGVASIWAMISLRSVLVLQYHKWTGKVAGLLALERRDFSASGYSEAPRPIPAEPGL
jgi:hypothetical protein